MSAGVAWLLCCASCTELELSKYRDDAFVREYQYALGEQYTTVNGLRVCYQELGKGEETIVVIPGLGTSIDFWQLVLPKLARDYHVIAVDPPGFGKSDKPDVRYSLKWITRQIIAFLDQKNIDHATLMGGSLGGHLAVMVTMERPQRVDRLVLMGSCGAWPEPTIPVVVGLETIWNDPLVVDHLRRRWPVIYHDIVGSDTEVSRRLFRYQMALRANLLLYWPEGRAASRSLKSIFYNSCRPRMDKVTQPTLLIWGMDDRIHLLAEGRYFREHLRDSRLVLVPNSAHEVILDQPDEMVRLVRTFMKEGTRAIQDTPLTQMRPEVQMTKTE